jgi:hypothetical protein
MERRSAPEALAIYLLEMMAAGRGAEVISSHVDAGEVLSRAFPTRFRGLTAYSKRLTIRTFGRLLLTATDPTSLKHILKDARITGRLLPPIEDVEIVELTIQRLGHAPIIGHMGIRGGQVVDLTLGPPPFQEILRGLRAILESPSRGGLSLYDAIESAVLSDTARMRVPPRNDVEPNGAGNWTLFTQTRPYTIQLPFEWRRAKEQETPKDLDFLVFSEDGRLSAAGISEKGVLGLEELTNLFLYQANRNELIAEGAPVDHTPFDQGGIHGTHLRFQCQQGQRSLTYRVLVFFLEGHIHQVAVFCKSEEEAELKDRIDAFFRGIIPSDLTR